MLQVDLDQHSLVPYKIEYPEHLTPKPPYVVHRQAQGKGGAIWTGSISDILQPNPASFVFLLGIILAIKGLELKLFFADAKPD